MGRYYTTDSGREGKFCFGMQSSDAPERFGMYENQSIIHYTAMDYDFNYDYLNELCKEFSVDKDRYIKEGEKNT